MTYDLVLKWHLCKKNLDNNMFWWGQQWWLVEMIMSVMQVQNSLIFPWAILLICIFPNVLMKSTTKSNAPKCSSNAPHRCFPDEPCWPSIEQWNALNESVHGRLRSQSFTSLMADVCWKSYTKFAFSRCINGTFPRRIAPLNENINKY